MSRERPSDYMLRKFRREFREPCEFWTGEDGTLMSLVIARGDYAEQALSEHHAFVDETFDPTRVKERFVYRARLEEGEDFGRARVCWRCTDEPTPFPVLEYELQIPR